MKVLGGFFEDFFFWNVVEVLSFGLILGEIIDVGVVGGFIFMEDEDWKEKEKEKEIKGCCFESCFKEVMEDFLVECIVGVNIDVGVVGGFIKIIFRVKKEDFDFFFWVNELIFEKIRWVIVDKLEIIVKSVDEMDNVVKLLELMYFLFGFLYKVMK